MSLEPAGGLMQQIKEIDFDFEIINGEDWLEQEPPAPDQIIKNHFDAGDKLAIFGAPKMRKSFFALQFFLCVAAGLDFLEFKVVKPRRVLIIQLEITAGHYHQRLHQMAKNLKIKPRDIADRVKVINGRGGDITISQIKAVARREKSEFILFDPLYKLNAGKEVIEDFSRILKEFDRLAEATGAAVAYIHHDPKGHPGDRDISSRGSGSNVLNRDYDACITLTRHRDDGEALVIERSLRNYQPRKSFSAEWDGGSFQLSSLPAVAQNSGNAATSGKKIDELIEEALPLLNEPIYCQEFDALLHDRLGFSQAKIRNVKKIMLHRDLIRKSVREPREGGGQYIGLPAAIEMKNQELKQLKLNLSSKKRSTVSTVNGTAHSTGVI